MTNTDREIDRYLNDLRRATRANDPVSLTTITSLWLDVERRRSANNLRMLAIVVAAIVQIAAGVLRTLLIGNLNPSPLSLAAAVQVGLVGGLLFLVCLWVQLKLWPNPGERTRTLGRAFYGAGLVSSICLLLSACLVELTVLRYLCQDGLTLWFGPVTGWFGSALIGATIFGRDSWRAWHVFFVRDLFLGGLYLYAGLHPIPPAIVLLGTAIVGGVYLHYATRNSPYPEDPIPQGTCDERSV